MDLAREYLHSRRGYRFGTSCCWLRIYEGAPGDAPVVVCSEPSEVGSSGLAEISPYLAAEVLEEHFAGSLPDLPCPMLWIEHRPGRRHVPDRYRLLTFPSYVPQCEGAGFIRRVTLGSPSREDLSAAEVAALTGGVA